MNHKQYQKIVSDIDHRLISDDYNDKKFLEKLRSHFVGMYAEINVPVPSDRVKKICACGCGKVFHPRKADVKRGWGKFSSKSCKARKQVSSGGADGTYELEDHPFSGDIQL